MGIGNLQVVRQELIGYEPGPIDARNVPARLTGLRTIFNGFHHLERGRRPHDADARFAQHGSVGFARQVIEDLDRDRAGEQRVFGLVDDTHAALAERRFDPVLFEGSADHWNA